MAKIKEVRCIRTRRNGMWVIVKVLTDQPGLYGIGSASEVNHPGAVVTAIEESIGPMLIGRDVSRIEDIW
ncbi:MAG: mandelate racemase, partial [Candidatus Latescibacteria bacterium]|nr:mandelate racemase [Candidatus Latescibacterota bacterium]